MPRPTLPLLAAAALACVLTLSPACTQLRPVTAPSGSGDNSVLTSGSADPDATSTFAPDAAGSPSAVPTPVDDDGPRKVATAPPVLATPRATLPPASPPAVGSAPSPAAGLATPTPVASPRPTIPTPQRPRQTVFDAMNGRAELVTLVAALKLAGLETTLSDNGPYTIFAPSNTAFQELPDGTYESLLRPENKGRLTKILSYHVVQGRYDTAVLRDGNLNSLEGQTLAIKVQAPATKVQGSAIETADILTDTGVIHIIGSVLLPPDLTPEADTVIALAARRPDLGTFVRAVESAGLVERLRDPGDLTLFAPTNRAFEKLPAGTVEKLLRADNQATLASLLKYHVVNGQVTVGQLRDGGLPTINGLGLPVVVTGQPTPRVGGGGVALGDLFAGNGVVHLIDTVAIPPGFVLP